MSCTSLLCTPKALVKSRYSGNHLPKHIGTRGCSDNWNVWITDTILIVCKAEHFLQRNSYEYHYFGVRISEDSDSWSSDKWFPTVTHSIWLFIRVVYSIIVSFGKPDLYTQGESLKTIVHVAFNWPRTLVHVTFDPRTLVHIAASSLVCNKGDYLQHS